MEIKVTREGSATVVSPAGDLIAAAVPELKTRLRELLQPGLQEVVIDLAGAYMIDSVGIGLLLAAYNSVHQAGGRFSVIHASEELMELFRTLRLHQHFSISGGASLCGI